MPCQDRPSLTSVAQVDEFQNVHRGEGSRAILLTLTAFLLLTAYYLLKVSREPGLARTLDVRRAPWHVFAAP